jgi:hypothetical protein
MARLDDDELNISPEVAAALGYHPWGANAARPRRNARAQAQPRHAHDHGDGNPAGLFGALFGVALLLILIIWAVGGIPGGVSVAGSTVTAGSPPLIAQSREGQSAADPRPAPQQQAPPAIETTNLETDSQQTMQSDPESEAEPNSVGSVPSPFSSRRDCYEHRWGCFNTGGGVVCRTFVNEQPVFRYQEHLCDLE